MEKQIAVLQILVLLVLFNMPIADGWHRYITTAILVYLAIQELRKSWKKQ